MFEEGLVKGVKAVGDLHGQRPIEETAQVTEPIGLAFVPAAVGIAPHGITGVEDRHAIIQPGRRFRDDIMKHGGQFAQLVPGAVVVAAVGLPQMFSFTKAVETVPASHTHDLYDALSFFGSQQLMDPGIGPGRQVQQRHGGFVIVGVVCRAFWVPLAHGQQQVPGGFAVAPIAAELIYERQRGRALGRLDAVGPVAPPDTPPFASLALRTGGILGRLAGIGGRFKQRIGLSQKGGPALRQRPLSQPAQPHHLGCIHEKARVCRRNTRYKVLQGRHGKGHTILWHGKLAGRAPHGKLPLFIFATITPIVVARIQGVVRAMGRPGKGFPAIDNRFKTPIRTDLKFIGNCRILRTPRKRRGIGLRHRIFCGTKPPCSRLRRMFIQFPGG
ncbi:MAG: hypothetical protein BWX80_01985 [Candidatus Hydrogenedentes bacterium ADurb.Bin101]|nr:MAG: hypothetical protein BWX80_01985 [Candidatus Hydrogenedentes bacterium ADurb.Bin101]